MAHLRKAVNEKEIYLNGFILSEINIWMAISYGRFRSQIYSQTFFETATNAHFKLSFSPTIHQHIHFALDSTRKRLSKWCLCFEITSTLAGKFIVLGIYENIKDTIH